uniref:Cadherin-related tumor suppressor n=1 Tax=Lygus hesperus TaxID=30085 RepID=A0A0A9Z6D6_LYGHE
MTAVGSCSCNQNELSKSAPPCPFVEIVDKLPECPCSCIPSINAGPPCPFKGIVPNMPSPVQCILRTDGTQNGSGGCPLSKGFGDNSCFSNESQLCVFAAKPMNFKDWPPYQCSCVPGTCPEISKNLIRSWGFDPMCFCPCPTVATTTNEAAAMRAASDGTMTGEKSKISQKSLVEGKIKSATGLSDVKASSRSSPSNVNLSSDKVNTSLRDNVTVGAGGSSKTAAANLSSAAIGSEEVDDVPAPPGGKLITRGKGFKIYEIDGEKILFNYSTKNCKWLKCECSQREKSCGCDEWVRMTKYRNCACPGARKPRMGSVKPVVLRDQRPPRTPERSTEAAGSAKSVKYS